MISRLETYLNAGGEFLRKCNCIKRAMQVLLWLRDVVKIEWVLMREPGHMNHPKFAQELEMLRALLADRRPGYSRGNGRGWGAPQGQVQ
jgi:hypothetical protein